jgi:hypothetical protein
MRQRMPDDVRARSMSGGGHRVRSPNARPLRVRIGDDVHQFLIDPTNCGGCGNVCYVGQTCQGGECTGCTSASAPDQCGAFVHQFPERPIELRGVRRHLSVGLCVQGQCLPCTIAAPNQCGGECTDVLTDPDNCGGCGNVCPSGATCEDGECAGHRVRRADADAMRRRPLRQSASDPNACGACGTVCPSEIVRPGSVRRLPAAIRRPSAAARARI